MRFGRSRWQWHWYDSIIVGLAAVIVYPDKVLGWIGEQSGRVFSWGYVVLVEAVAIALLFVAMALLMPAYPRLEWWYPLPFIGILAVFRSIMWFIIELFGFRDS